MTEIPVTFNVKNKQVVGMLHLPRRKNPPAIIMLHGWGTGKAGNAQFTFVRAAREFCNKGVAVLRFDFRGVGDSEGEFKDYCMTSMIEDTEVAIDFISKRPDVDKNNIGLLGWSNGGSAAVSTALRNKKVKCLILWSTPANLTELWSPADLAELKNKKGLVIDWYSSLSISLKSALDSFRYKTSKEIKKIKVPVLLVSGTNDLTVYPTQTQKLYRYANKPKKIILIKNAGHAFQFEYEKQKLFAESLKWIKRWLK